MPEPARSEVLLEVRNLRKFFPIEKGLLRRQIGEVRAVDDVSFDIREGETFGLVGESGCGKTTLGRCIVRGIDPDDGLILLRLPDGRVQDLARLDRRELRRLRRHFHMIFQDPYSSLDPRMTVLDIIAEPIRENNLAETAELQERVMELMQVVGLEMQHLKR